MDGIHLGIILCRNSIGSSVLSPLNKLILYLSDLNGPPFQQSSAASSPVVIFHLLSLFSPCRLSTLVDRLSIGSPTTSQIEFSVPNRRACCPDLWQSLWGTIGFNSLFSVYINDVALAAGDSLIHLYTDDTILYTSGPSLDAVTKPPNELQCQTTLLPWPPIALKC